MVKKRAVSVLGTIFIYSDAISTSVGVYCGLIEMKRTPRSLIFFQRGYIWWSATVNSTRLFFQGSQPTSTITSVWSATTSHDVCGEYTSISPIIWGRLICDAPPE